MKQISLELITFDVSNFRRRFLFRNRKTDAFFADDSCSVYDGGKTGELMNDYIPINTRVIV